MNRCLARSRKLQETFLSGARISSPELRLIPLTSAIVRHSAGIQQTQPYIYRMFYPLREEEIWFYRFVSGLAQGGCGSKPWLCHIR